MKKLTSLQFIKKAKKIHGDYYNYNEVIYLNSLTKIKIICSTHGMFEQRPTDHLNGSGCKLCGNYKNSSKKTKNVEYLIEQFKAIHGNKYNYSKIKYFGAHHCIEIYCNVHGSFKQTPNNHLKGYGCKKCGIIKGNDKKRKLVNKLISQFIEIHGNKYIYDQIIYLNNNTHIKIICPIHGEFEQLPSDHLNGHGCKKCGILSTVNKKTTTYLNFLNKASLIHVSKYEYNNVLYKNSHTKINITCKLHGDFKQTPYSHLNGNGCPICQESKGENIIAKYLEINNIVYERQKKFENCKNLRTLLFDFYLPDFNLCIEYNGIQHYKSIEYFGGDNEFIKIKKNDLIKNDYCKANNINLLIIDYSNYQKINEILNLNLKCC